MRLTGITSEKYLCLKSCYHKNVTNTISRTNKGFNEFCLRNFQGYYLAELQVYFNAQSFN